MPGFSKINPETKTILNSFGDFVFVLDNDGAIIYANDSALNALGYSSGEMNGINVLEVHPPDRRSEAGSIVAAMLRGTEKCCPIPLVAKSGTLIPVETKVSEIRLNGHNYLLGISRDISGWIETNQRLAESEERFRKTFDLSSRLMAISDLDTGEYYDVNEMFVATTGFSREEVIGHTSLSLKLFSSDMRDSCARELRNMGAIRGKVVDIFLEKKAQTISCSFDATTFEVNHRPYLLSMAEDITDRIRNRENLARSQQQLKLILDATDDGFWDWNVKTGQVEFSHSWAKMLGYCLDEVEPEVGFWEKRVHPEDRPVVFAALESHLAGDTDQYINEHRVGHKDGGWIWVLDRGKIVERDEMNVPVRMVGTHTNITDKKAAEEQLRYRESFELFINEIATSLITIPYTSIDKQIEDFLKRTGEFIGVDRSYIFLFNPVAQTMSNTHEWCDIGISAQREFLQDLPLDTFAWSMVRIMRREIINVSDVDALPDDAASEREILKAQEIRSVLLTPLISVDSVIGFIGFDSVRIQRAWNPDTELLLRNASIMIANAIHRKEYEEEIHKHRNHLQLLIHERTADLESSNSALNHSLGLLAGQNKELLKFKTIAEKVNYAIFILSKDGTINYANRKAAETVGCKKPSLQGRDFLAEFVDPGSYSYYRLVNAFRRKQEASSLEIIIIDKRGGRFHAFANVSAIHDKETGFQFFVLSLNDLTQRQNEEQELKVLWQSVEHSANGIIITDKDQVIRYVNQQYLETAGYTSDELLGSKPKVVRSYRHEADFYRDIDRTILSGQIWRGRIINRKKDGSEYTEDIVISPVKNSHGEITHFIAITRDITQELRQEKELRQSEKLRALGTLAGGVAHDFNNILQIVQVYAELLKISKVGDPVFDEHQGEILKACQRGKSLVNNILTFSRHEPDEMAPYSFEFLVREIIHIARPLYPSSIEIIQNIGTCGTVMCDPVQIQQIFFNLFNNSVDAMNGKGTIRVVAGLQNESGVDEILLKVIDTGRGMSQETVNRAFDPFFTTKGVGEGTGLGLSTVMGIIRKHDGRIQITSVIGQGTEVYITFPLYN